ncbi:Methyl-accepting chemotaxis protein McpC [compost metagenome]
MFKLVRAIDADIAQAVDNTAINEEIVHIQNEQIVESGEIFSEIVNSVRYITEQISVFSAESDQMLDSSQQISGAIQNISAITQQSAAGTQQVAASMNEQIHAIASVAEQTEKMTGAVIRLQKAIHVFKF